MKIYIGDDNGNPTGPNKTKEVLKCHGNARIFKLFEMIADRRITKFKIDGTVYEISVRKIK